MDQLGDPGSLWDIVGGQAAGSREGVEQRRFSCSQQHAMTQDATLLCTAFKTQALGPMTVIKLINDEMTSSPFITEIWEQH